MSMESFEALMQAGDSAAWDQNWAKAIEHYMAALRISNTSTAACNSLGYALFQTGRLEDALRVYGQAHKLDPDDPLPVEKSADVLERMGRLNDAAKQYLLVADIYLGQHDLEKAIDNWERATRITPGLIKIHQKLAMAYERTGQKGQALNEYLKLAFNFQSGGKPEIAMQALERALRLDSKEPRVLNAITAVRADRPIDPSLLEAPPEADKPADSDEFDINYQAADAHAEGPIGDAVEHALERLAADVFESGIMDMSVASALQAIEMHRAGIKDEAIEAYIAAEQAGMRSPALLFNLGVLLEEEKDWDIAIGYLEQVASNNHTLNAGASHALSLAYIGLGRWKEAAVQLINTLRQVELSLAMNEEEAQELSSLYHQLSATVEQTDEQTLENFSQRLSEMLTGADWKRRVAQTRSRIEELISKDINQVLVDLAQGEEVIESMNLVENYMRQKRYNLAMVETHQLIAKEPDYLGAHLRVAQIMMEMSHVEQAIQKYNLIARTYLLRGDENRAAEILNEVIKVAPGDINLRLNLIELLEQQERWGEVLDQYVDLGSTYRDFADMSSARMTYDQALKLAQRINAPQEKMLAVLHKMGELDMERLEYRGALRTYQQVVETAPDDARARRALIEINYRLNNGLQGIKEVDQLLQVYARQKRGDLILEMLEELSSSYPDDMGLRARLGRVYQQTNQAAKAVVQYEELRRLQAAAGLHDEARQTIKLIIGLNPPGVEQYQQLLQQMGGG